MRVLKLGYLKTCIKNQLYLFNTKLLRNTNEYANFQFSVVIMRSLPFKKYQTCKLESNIIDYRGCYVKICAFYRASATALFFPDFKIIWAN